MVSEAEKTTELSVVIPVYNGERVLASTMATLAKHLETIQCEIIVVENGSSDNTYQVALDHAANTEFVRFKILRSQKGMGNALRCGIESSVGARVLLTADDLPFGVGDLIQDSQLPEPKPSLVIGSKAHKLSNTHRGAMRSVSTFGFRALRWIILQSRTGDSQGTLIANGPWIRSMVAHFDDPGFLFSTQVVYAVEKQHLNLVEVPVTLSPDENPSETTIRIPDILKMAKGLLKLRLRRKEFSAAPSERRTS